MEETNVCTILKGSTNIVTVYINIVFFVHSVYFSNNRGKWHAFIMFTVINYASRTSTTEESLGVHWATRHAFRKNN